MTAAETASDPSPTDVWHKTACILCECNCGVEVKLDGTRFVRIRGNRDHVGSKGYTCEKALRLDHYQNHRARLTSPMRRRDDGSYEEIDWETAIAEVAAGLSAVRDTHGGDKILYYGGGGQGNHLGGAYGGALTSALGVRYRSNALAQEKTGEAFVDGRLYRGHTRGDFERTEVAVFVGKNPWQSHGFAHARRTMREIARDPDRSMVVIDPRRTESADMADHFLQVRPGTDAFAVAAMAAILVSEGWIDRDFLTEHVVGVEPVLAALDDVPVDDYAERCGVPVAQLEAVAERIGTAASVAIFEDLGVEQAPHSTLVSYLEKLLWILPGSFAKPGGMHLHSTFVNLTNMGSAAPSTGGTRPARPRTTPVTGARIIAGLIPCNSIVEEVLTEHADRLRAMIVETANPAHSLADTPRFKEAMAALDFSVVIDVTMTETARQADYVLPAASQFEKPESVFFNFEFPDNVFSLREPLFPPEEGTLPEPEIHARLVEALGVFDDADLAPLREAASESRAEFAAAFMQAAIGNPELAGVGAVVLYRTLGPTLPEGLAPAAALWFVSHQCATTYPEAVRRAGIEGDDGQLGDALFDAILESDDGVVFTSHTYEEAWDLIRYEDHKIHVHIPELLEELTALVDAPVGYSTDEYPFILSAGERRSFTANTIFRDPGWRKRDGEGALRISPTDATALGVVDGDRVLVTTVTGSAEPVVEVTDTLQAGHVSLPNGMGLDYPDETGEHLRAGVAPNELTATGWRDHIAGTPWHKHVPARIEALPA